VGGEGGVLKEKHRDAGKEYSRPRTLESGREKGDRSARLGVTGRPVEKKKSNKVQ